ncbi:hypothetical protein [Aestuariivirga sp.]|jgi:hypothetical protein|uniref:hypothetical protein n=1 Tax=Aestuariivirga sp. TaxID=2650926 RepID=UPI003783BF17
MSHEISRMYASPDTARKAADELKEEGFGDVFVVTPPASGDTPASAIAAQIAQGRVLLADARIYAKGVAAGGSLVTVHAPFGSGMLATSILESHGPIASGMPEPEPETIWDEATPLSSAMMIPVLLPDATPMSKVIGFSPLMSNDCGASEAIGLPLLTDGKAPEGRWGMPFLINNPAPLSSLVGLPLLKPFRPMGW